MRLPSFPTQFNRRALLLGLLASGAAPLLANAPVSSPRPEARSGEIALSAAGSVEDLIAASGLSGDVAFVVTDAETGEVLEARKPLLALPPASVTKSVTTLYGLESLGGDYRFSTRIMATGSLQNGRLTGDLYLVGGGDPTLDADALGELASRLKEVGLREVRGKTYVYSGAIAYQKSIDPDQPDHLGYNPSLSGLNLNFNRVYFEWAKSADGFAVTMDARARKFRPRVAMATMKVVDRDNPLFSLNSTSKLDNWTVAASGLGRKGGRWLPVRRPQYYAAEVFQTIARSYGVELPNFVAIGQVPKATVLAEWQSDSLTVILREMLKYSTNLVAEAVGMTASKARGQSPKTLSASGRAMSDWVNKTTGSKRAKFRDHSGLGEESQISPSDMVQVLMYSGWNGPLRALMKDIDFRDDKGKPLKNQPIEVQAKTGTLNFVSALAGYARTPKGRKLCFAIFTADMAHRAKIPRAQRERPVGARGWNRHAKELQQQLIERWAGVFEI